MKRIIYLLLISVSVLYVKGQDSIRVKIEDVKQTQDSLNIYVSFINKSRKPIRIFKPTEKDICCGLIGFYLFNKDLKDDYLELSSCDSSLDLDSYRVNCFNTVILRKNEKITLKFLFDIQDAPIEFWNKKTYEIRFVYSMKGVNFIGTTDFLFRENIYSDDYILHLKHHIVPNDASL